MNPISEEELVRMIGLAEAARTDDRTVAIVCLAHIEDLLEAVVKSALPGLTEALAKKVFGQGGNAPLATFANKVLLLESLDRIAPDFADELKVMARIRNRFAHNMPVDDFDHTDVRDLVDNLRMRDRHNMYYLASFLIIPDDEQKTRRGRFVYSATSVALSLYDVAIGKNRDRIAL